MRVVAAAEEDSGYNDRGQYQKLLFHRSSVRAGGPGQRTASAVAKVSRSTIGSLKRFQHHDRDKAQDENSALFVAAANFSLEWSTDWMALLAGVQFPYQYVGPTSGGGPAVPAWGWGPWMVALGVAASPF